MSSKTSSMRDPESGNSGSALTDIPVLRHSRTGFPAGLIVLALVIVALCAAPGLAKPPAAIEKAVVTVRDGTTALRLTLSHKRVPNVATLSQPYRAVIDFPRTIFRLPPGTGQEGGGLIAAFRYGQLTAQTARLVIDATSAFSVKRLRLTNRAEGRWELVVELTAVPPQSFVRQGREIRHPAQQVLRAGRFDHEARKARRRPVIIIDPGHGGPDPGAIGPGNTNEKAIALGVGMKLARRLRTSGRYKVIMTRTTDVFVSLADRVRISENSAADLFISLHADATPHAADTIRGASVYTLSGRASDEQARAFAAKENAADVLAGFSATTVAANGPVASILIDLLKRETQMFSHRFRKTVVQALHRKIRLSSDPRRAAAFAVLKQTSTPSVLIELGYISHPGDEAEMHTTAWQNRASKAIAHAVQRYFKSGRHSLQ